MGYNRATMKQADLTRYLKAMQAAGVTDFRVTVRPDGTLEIAVGNAKPTNPNEGWEDL